VNWRWLGRTALTLLHDESLAEHGGRSGLRDDGLLESALARARNPAEFGDPAIAGLAAAYGLGLAGNHPFVDGNKRTAFLAGGVLPALNGYRIRATQADATLTLFAVAAGDIDEQAFAAWIRAHALAR